MIRVRQWRKNRRGAASTLSRRRPDPRAHVFNLFPRGIFMQCCPSLNYLTGSKSRVSNCHSLSPSASAAFLFFFHQHFPLSSPPIPLVVCTYLHTGVNNWQMWLTLKGRLVTDAKAPFNQDRLIFSPSGEVYILASSKSMAQSHSGKLYKLMDPKRYCRDACRFSALLDCISKESRCATLFVLRDCILATRQLTFNCHAMKCD